MFRRRHTQRQSPVLTGRVARLTARARVVLWALLVLPAVACTPLPEPPAVEIEGPAPFEGYRPLDRLVVHIRGQGTVSVEDGKGRVYLREPAQPLVHLQIGGALGRQRIQLLSKEGRLQAEASFTVVAETRIEDESGRMGSLLDLLVWTMRNWIPGLTDGVGDLHFQGRHFAYYVHWLRDHVHTLKGMRYFDAQGGEVLEVFRQAQRADGMIWDFFRKEARPGNFYDTAFEPLGYSRWVDGLLFARMPVENDVEYLFVEGLHMAWQMTGDQAVLDRNLDAAIKALDYSVQSPARWSRRRRLLKRAYTIDSWDFQQAAVSEKLFPRWGSLLIDPQRTRFGIMHGDNTGYAAACELLAEMLERVERVADAERFRDRAAKIRRRLDRVSWLGSHYRHWVPELRTTRRYLAPGERAQISLSNAYALNRGVDAEKAEAIIETYLELRDRLPQGSPGEWYSIYPPFEHGFEEHAGVWEYVNGGVLPIVAGELARGAFRHGYEAYGADILERVLELGLAHGHQMHFAYTGAHPSGDAPEYTLVDLAPYATMDLGGVGAEGVPSWMAGPPDDHLDELPTGHQEFAGVPFLITDPAQNERRAVVAVSGRADLPSRVQIPVESKPKSLYVLHSTGFNGNAKLAGSISWNYADGSQRTQYLVRGSNVAHWWFPELKGKWASQGRHEEPPLVELAWRGKNDASTSVGLYWYGLNNPEPDKELTGLTFESPQDASIYAVVGLTLASQPLHRPLPAVSYGGPDNWAAAAVTQALIEGLAGVVDQSAEFQDVEIAPRWAATGTGQVSAEVCYPGSGGYVAYHYLHDSGSRSLNLSLTGSGERASVRMLLPRAVQQVVGVYLNEQPVSFAVERVRDSFYVTFAAALPRAQNFRIYY